MAFVEEVEIAFTA